MLSTCNEGHAPMEILHGRRVQIVYCWDVEMINANFLQEANDRLDAKIWHATSSLREGAAIDLQPRA